MTFDTVAQTVEERLVKKRSINTRKEQTGSVCHPLLLQERMFCTLLIITGNSNRTPTVVRTCRHFGCQNGKGAGTADSGRNLPKSMSLCAEPYGCCRSRLRQFDNPDSVESAREREVICGQPAARTREAYWPTKAEHAENIQSVEYGPEDNMRTRLQGADMKVVILGDVSIGKTSLLIRYMEKRFENTPSPTVAATFTVKTQDDYNIAIWDTAGQERYCGLSSFYCRNAEAAILAFDITNRESYIALMNRYVQLMGTARDFSLKVVVGTKSDLLRERKRQVSVSEAQQFAININPTLAADDVPYFETSSVTGANVDSVFQYIFEHCCLKKSPISCCLKASSRDRVTNKHLAVSTLSLAHSATSCCIY